MVGQALLATLAKVLYSRALSDSTVREPYEGPVAAFPPPSQIHVLRMSTVWARSTSRWWGRRFLPRSRRSSLSLFITFE